MFDFTTLQKTFETQSKMFADIVQPVELKDFQKKSKEFALTLLDTNTKVTKSVIEAVGSFASPQAKSTASDLVDTTYQYAKEIIETGTIKGFAANGNKK
jgi:hypothetical protein